MRTGALIEQINGQAHVHGGMDILSPSRGQSAVWRGLPANADERWRPVPDPATGAIHLDPEFSLPTTAGPLSWRLWFDRQNAETDVDGEWGFSWRASFPIRLYRPGSEAVINYENGTFGIFSGEVPGKWGLQGRDTGDTLVTNVDDSWLLTLGGSNVQYYFPPGDYVTATYRATPHGQRLTYHYNKLGQLESVEEPAGRRVTLSYNGDGKVQTVEDWGGRGLVVLTYVGSDLTEVWQQEGVVTGYRYDADHYLTEIIDPAGYRTTYAYFGHVTDIGIKSRNVAGSISSYEYEPYPYLHYEFTMTQTDPMGRIWTYGSSFGQPRSTIDPLGHQEFYRPIFGYGNLGGFQNALGYRVTFTYGPPDDYSQWLSQQDALGNRLTFEQDSYWNVRTITNALGHVTTLAYGAYPQSHTLEALVDPLGNRTTFGYYGNGLPQYAEDAKGYRTTFEWSPTALLTTLTDARGYVWTYLHDSVGNLTGHINPRRERWTLAYDKMARLVSVQNPLGFVGTAVYDTRNLVQASIDPLGNRTTYQYDASGNPIERMDAQGNRWSVVYNLADEPTALIDPLGYRTSFYYDEAARLTLTLDSLGNRTTWIYDAANQLQAVIDPLGYRTSWVYDSTGRVTEEINARGYRTTRVFDAIGRVVTVISALGQQAHALYDGRGLPTALIDPLGNRATLQYDVRGLLEVLTDRRGFRTTFAYNAAGLPIAMQDARGALWKTVFDEIGRTQATVDPLGYWVSAVYDAAGRPIATVDARGNRWSQSFDARGLPTGSTDPLGNLATMRYDATGQLVTWTNARGQLATLTYNARGEVTGQAYADGSRVTPSFDAVGRIVTVQDATGRYTMTYSARGDLLAVQAPQHPGGGILTYDYDPAGNQTLLNSWLGRLTFAYDPLNRPTVLFDPDGHLTTWTFDSRGLVTRQDNWNGTKATFTHDSQGHIIGILHSTSSGKALAEAYYTWDEAGEPTKRLTDTGTTTWVYDLARQLQAEWHEVGVIATWSYDGAGNRTQQQRLQSAVQTVTKYSFDNANQIVTFTAAGVTTTFTFDATGNLRSEAVAGVGFTTYSWDPQDRLTLVAGPSGPVATYTYRFDGLRATVDQGEGRVTQVWDVPGSTGYGDLLEEIGPSGLLRAYFRGQRLATQKQAGGSFVVGQDYLGSSMFLTDASQAVAADYQRSAWGELLASSGITTPLGWLGEWGYYQDTAQRTWVRERGVDVSLGRWNVRDPIGLLAGPNLYSYVHQNPLSDVDPSGLYSWGEYFSDVGQVFLGYGDFLVEAAKGLALAPFALPLLGLELGSLALTCGWREALRATGMGMWHSYTDWLTTDDPREFGHSFANFLSLVSPALKRVPSPRPYVARTLGQRVVDHLAVQLAQDPGVAAELLGRGYYESARSNAKRTATAYGVAMERGVARGRGIDPVTRKLFNTLYEQTGQMRDSRGRFVSMYDFRGKWWFSGLKFDVTTPEQAGAHRLRYGDDLIVWEYIRPSDLARFPMLPPSPP